MNVIIADDRYRVIAKPIATYEDIPCYVIGYRVQIRVWKFWITIKAFNEGTMMMLNFVNVKLLNCIIK